MLLELAQFRQGRARLQRVQLHHAARGARLPHGAGDSFITGPLVIRKLTAFKIGQAVRNDGPQDASDQGRHAHHGRRADPGFDRRYHAAVGATCPTAFVWVVLVVTLGFGAIGWVDDYRKVVEPIRRACRRRTKFSWQSVIGLVAAVYLAFAVSAPSSAKIFDLFMAWVASGFSMTLPPKADLILPFFKNIAYPLGVWGFIVLTLLRHRRHQQRGQPHRRPGRPGDHAGGDGRRRARHFRLCRRQRGVFEIPAAAVYPGRGRADRVLRRARRGPASVSSGSTPTRPRCSWATWARWRSAPRWAPWR